MPKFRVLVTDYAWPDLDIERAILNEVDAEIVLPTENSLAALKAAAQGVDAIMTNWAKTTADVIAAAPNCKIVARLGIGLDNIDVAYCTERKIPVTNVPDYCLIEVAEQTLALVFGLGRKIGWYHHATKSGKYELQAGPPMFRMQGQTLGLIGFGNIARLVAEKALGLGLKVLVCNRTKKDAPAGVEWTDLDGVLSRSDYVSLHVPATPETKKMMNAAAFAKMKPTAYLINTSRGALVDHDALAAVLAAGTIAGAGLDVQDPEPCDLTIAPYNDPRVIVCPHAAFVSKESLENLRSRTARQTADRLSGKTPENVRNPQVL
ncbi:MAG: C-terminal binding protein [Pirellulales bacterium]